MMENTTESFLKYYHSMIPDGLFEIKEKGSVIESIQHIIDQAHPGTTAMQLTKLQDGLAEASIPWDMKNRALHGFMHGGVFFTVGDTLTALLCMYHIKDRSELMLTRNASMRYLRPVDKDTVLARAVLLNKDGAKLNFKCDFLNEQGKKTGQAKYSYVIISE